MLFREEVLAEKTTSQLGSVLLVANSTARLLAICALATAALVVIFLFTFEHTRRSRVTGVATAESGISKVSSPISGVILKKTIAEGDLVKPGMVLASVSGERVTEQSAQALAQISNQVRSRIESLRVEKENQTALLDTQRKGLEGRLRAIMSEVSQAKMEVGILERRAALTQKTVERFRELARTEFVSPLQVQQREEELLDQQARLQSLHRNRMGLEREADAIRSELAQWQAKLQSQISLIERSILSAEQELAESETRRQVGIVAQQEGRVTGILAEPGQSIVAGQLLMNIVPIDSKLQAHLFVPGRSAGFIKAGQRVLLRFHAFPYQKFGHTEGTIKNVSLTALAPQELPPAVQANFQSNEPVFRVVADLATQDILAYGERKPIQAGMQMEADVLLDRRSLIEWVLEPLYSIKGKL